MLCWFMFGDGFFESVMVYLNWFGKVLLVILFSDDYNVEIVCNVYKVGVCVVVFKDDCEMLM